MHLFVKKSFEKQITDMITEFNFTQFISLFCFHLILKGILYLIFYEFE